MQKLPDRIDAAQVPMYERTMSIVRKVSEEAAPELFKWVGWSVIISAIEIVRRKTGADWLLVIEIVLALSMLLRMQSKMLFLRMPEKKLDDGSILLDTKWWLPLLGGFICWGMTLLLTIGLAGLIADSELLQSNVFLDCRDNLQTLNSSAYPLEMPR